MYSLLLYCESLFLLHYLVLHNENHDFKCIPCYYITKFMIFNILRTQNVNYIPAIILRSPWYYIAKIMMF